MLLGLVFDPKTLLVGAVFVPNAGGAELLFPKVLLKFGAVAAPKVGLVEAGEPNTLDCGAEFPPKTLLVVPEAKGA